MTVTMAIEKLKNFIRDQPDTRQWPIELQAHMEVRDGDPYSEACYHHAEDCYAYRAARFIASERKRIEGI